VEVPIAHAELDGLIVSAQEQVAAGLAAHTQAFFLGPNGGILGATNGLRFVFGDP